MATQAQLNKWTIVYQLIERGWSPIDIGMVINKKPSEVLRIYKQYRCRVWQYPSVIQPKNNMEYPDFGLNMDTLRSIAFSQIEPKNVLNTPRVQIGLDFNDYLHIRKYFCLIHPDFKEDKWKGFYGVNNLSGLYLTFCTYNLPYEFWITLNTTLSTNIVGKEIYKRALASLPKARI